MRIFRSGFAATLLACAMSALVVSLAGAQQLVVEIRRGVEERLEKLESATIHG